MTILSFLNQRNVSVMDGRTERPTLIIKKLRFKNVTTLIFSLACRAKVLLGKTEWAQLGLQEWLAKEKVGNIA